MGNYCFCSDSVYLDMVYWEVWNMIDKDCLMVRFGMVILLLPFTICDKITIKWIKKSLLIPLMIINVPLIAIIAIPTMIGSIYDMVKEY